MAWAISVMSLCCISVGMFVLYSILQNQINKKQVDMALQKLMGMSDNAVFKTLFTEYMVISLSSVAVGNIIGMGIALMVSQLFLDGVFVFNGTFFVMFNTFLIALTAGVIYLSYKNNYRKKLSELLS